MRLFLGGVELSDESRGGDETRHRYQTHSEWHTDSKFVGLLKVGYQTSILENKYSRNQIKTYINGRYIFVLCMNGRFIWEHKTADKAMYLGSDGDWNIHTKAAARAGGPCTFKLDF